MSRYVILCSTKCCPEIAFLVDGELSLYDDYHGKVTLDRATFENWIAQHCSDKALNPEEELLLPHQDGQIRVKRRELQGLHDQYEQHKDKHPMPVQANG